MSELISADSDLLRKHAAQVDEISADVCEVLSTVQGVNLIGGAFGLMCMSLIPAAFLVTEAAKIVIGVAGEMLARTADEVRGFAADQDRQEQETLDVINGLCQRFPG